ncbi:MAG TPA: hypothetical protein VIH57_16075 [Bacteroidales bacterium]
MGVKIKQSMAGSTSKYRVMIGTEGFVMSLWSRTRYVWADKRDIMDGGL